MDWVAIRVEHPEKVVEEIVRRMGDPRLDLAERKDLMTVYDAVTMGIANERALRLLDKYGIRYRVEGGRR